MTVVAKPRSQDRIALAGDRSVACAVPGLLGSLLVLRLPSASLSLLRLPLALATRMR